MRLDRVVRLAVLAVLVLLGGAWLGPRLVSGAPAPHPRSTDRSAAQEDTVQNSDSPVEAALSGDSYIVVLRSDVVGGAADAAADLDQTFDLDVRYVYNDAITGFAATIAAEDVAALEQDPRVAFVAPDLPVYGAAQDVPAGISRVEAAPAAKNATARIDGVDQRVNVDVAIIDTGIIPNHPDLNVVGGFDCIGGGWSDDEGHGTHVAGTVGALDNGIGVVGMAPGARLWAVRVLDAGNSGSTASIICGVDWVTRNAATIDVANMSLRTLYPVGTDIDDRNCGLTIGDAEHQAICRSVAAGVTYVVAAGNDKVNATRVTPAAYDEVITVSGMADSDGRPGGLGSATRCGADDALYVNSNFGADVDLAAPGADVLSTYNDGGYVSSCGTSMASPHVAGAAALIIAARGRIGPAAVKAELLANRENAAIPNDPDGINEGILNVNDGAPWGGGATAPANDDFAGALAVTTRPFTRTQDVSRATGSGDDPRPSCRANGPQAPTQSVWYRFTSTGPTTVVVDTVGSAYDTVLAAYTGARGALTQVACNDDIATGNTRSRVTLVFSAAATVHLMVAPYGAGTATSLTLNLVTQPPANDAFTGALVADARPYANTQDVSGATAASGDPTPTCRVPTAAPSQTVWYRTTPAADGALDVNTTGSGYDTVLAVYTGAQGNLTEVACNDDVGGPNNIRTSRVIFNVTGGTTYYILVAPYAAGGAASLTLNVAAVAGAAPVVTPPAAQSGSEGTTQSFTLGSFTDADGNGPWTVSVLWGDNTAAETFSVGAVGSLGTRTHTYGADGTYTVTLTVTDPAGGVSAAKTFQVVVTNVPPVLRDPPDQTATAGVAKTFSLSYLTDPGADDTSWTVTVVWGDNTPNTVLTGPGQVAGGSHAYSAAHTYATPGTKTVTVRAVDGDGGASATQSFTVTVTGSVGPPTLVVDPVGASQDSSKFNGWVTATLTGFTPNSAVTLRWPQLFPIDANSAPSTDLLASGTTDAAGRATLTFRTPLQPFAKGGYVVTALDAAGRSATDTLRVIPRILLNEERGNASTRLRVYFYGFSPNERIEVRWHTGPDGNSSSSVIFTLTVDANGRAVSRAFFPPTGALGGHKVVGKVIGVSRSASTVFTLTAGGSSVDDPTATPTATATLTPAPEASPTPEATVTPTPEPTATATPEPAPTDTATPEPTATPVPNASPVADAGDDRTVPDADGSGDEAVTLDGSASADPEGDALAYAWSVGGAAVATGATAEVALPVGIHTVTLTVTDAQGATATDEVVLTVEAALAEEPTSDDGPPVDGPPAEGSASEESVG